MNVTLAQMNLVFDQNLVAKNSWKNGLSSLDAWCFRDALVIDKEEQEDESIFLAIQEGQAIISGIAPKGHPLAYVQKEERLVVKDELLERYLRWDAESWACGCTMFGDDSERESVYDNKHAAYAMLKKSCEEEIEKWGRRV